METTFETKLTAIIVRLLKSMFNITFSWLSHMYCIWKSLMMYFTLIWPLHNLLGINHSGNNHSVLKEQKQICCCCCLLQVLKLIVFVFCRSWNCFCILQVLKLFLYSAGLETKAEPADSETARAGNSSCLNSSPFLFHSGFKLQRS